MMDGGGAGGVIQGQVPEKTDRRMVLTPLFPPQVCGNARAQFVQVKGLYNVIVCPGLEADDFIADSSRAVRNRMGQEI